MISLVANARIEYNFLSAKLSIMGSTFDFTVMFIYVFFLKRELAFDCSIVPFSMKKVSLFCFLRLISLRANKQHPIAPEYAGIK